MNALMSDGLFNAQLVRTIGYAPYGGADFGECASTSARIGKVDVDLWHREWLATADRIHAEAVASFAAGARVSARGGFLRAANYYRTAGLFLMGAPVDPRLTEAHRREVESFRAGASLLERPPDIVAIPYQDTAMPGYFFRAGNDSARRATVILVNGYDGTAEELYFTNGAAALERGYNVLCFDGPGQGALIIDQGIVFRPDWEAVITPVVDFVLSRSDVDPGRLAVMGLSFGGYLAPRAATAEHRLFACVSDCGPYDLFDASASRLPKPLARQLPDGNPTVLRALARILGVVMRKPTAGWALRRNLMVHGLTEPMEFFRLAPSYSLKGIEAQITCPTLVCAAEGDDLSSRAHLLFERLTCEKTYVEFRGAEGAGEHCESGARTRFHQVAFDWLDETLHVRDGSPIAAENAPG